MITLTPKALEYVRKRGGNLHLFQSEQISNC